MLDCLVQHQSQQTSSVGHGGPDVTLLFKQLIQLVPLRTKKTLSHSHRFTRDLSVKSKATVVKSDSPLALAPGPLLLFEVFPSCNACYIFFWRSCSNLLSAQRRSSPADTHTPHPLEPEDKKKKKRGSNCYQIGCENGLRNGSGNYC